MSNYEVTDLVNYALEKNPTGFRAAFDEVIDSKIADALELRKQEIASTYLSRDELDDEDFEVDDSEENNTEEVEETNGN